jgi:hypothetical protein
MRRGAVIAVIPLEGASVASVRTVVADEPPLRVTDEGANVQVVPGMMDVPQLNMTVLV